MKKFFVFMFLAVFVLLSAGCSGNNRDSAAAGEGTDAAVTVDVGQTVAAENEAASQTVAAENEAAAQTVPEETGTAAQTASASVASTTAQGSGNTVIGAEAAENIALEHAGASRESAALLKSRLVIENGREVYDIEFFADSKEFDYEIDAHSGEIISFDAETETRYAAQTTVGGTANSGQTEAAVTLEEAKAAALEKAGVAGSDAVFTETKLEYDDGILCYKIDFISGATEYEVEINAQTGAIIGYDYESVLD